MGKFKRIKDAILNRFSWTDSMVLVFFLGVTLLSRYWMLRDIATNLYRGIPNIYGWMALWNCRVLDTFGFLNYWNANAMYLFENNLALSESMMGFAPFIYPIWKISGNPILTVNILSILFLWLASTITYFVLRKFNFERLPSIVGALIFAFYPWVLKMSSLGRFHMQGLIWLPIIIYANYKFWETYRRKYLLILFLFFLWTFLFTLYYGIFLTVLLGVWNLIWFLSERKHFSLKNVFNWCLTVFLVWLVMLPMLLVYKQVADQLGVERTLENQVQYTGPAWSWIVPTDENWLWRKTINILPKNLNGYAVENFIFPGMLASILFLLAMFYRRFPKWLSSLKWTAFSLFVFAFGPFLLGLPWKIPMPFTALWTFFYPIRGTRNPHRLAVFVILCLAFLAAFLLNRLIRKKRVPVILQIALVAFLILEFVTVEETKRAIGKSTPLVYRHLDKKQDELKIAEIPMTMHVNLKALTFSAFHWHQILNGTDNYHPPIYGHFETWTHHEFPSDYSVRLLQAFGVNRVIVHENAYGAHRGHLLNSLLKRKAFIFLGRSTGRSVWQLSQGEEVVLFKPAAHIRINGPSKLVGEQVHLSLDVPLAKEKIIFNYRAPFQNRFFASKRWWVTAVLDGEKFGKPIDWKTPPVFNANNHRWKFPVQIDPKSKRLTVSVDIYGDHHHFAFAKKLETIAIKKQGGGLPAFLLLPEGFDEIPFEEIQVKLEKRLKLVKGPKDRPYVSGFIRVKNMGPYYWRTAQKNDMGIGVEVLQQGKIKRYRFPLPHDLFPGDETDVPVFFPRSVVGDLTTSLSSIRFYLYGKDADDLGKLIKFSESRASE